MPVFAIADGAISYSVDDIVSRALGESFGVSRAYSNHSRLLKKLRPWQWLVRSNRPFLVRMRTESVVMFDE